jgi:eukaryotic-like serine/threonine-protein kinase
MELVEGKDLDALASSGPLPIPVIIFVISEVLRGLGHAHDLPVGMGLHGIVHRDVSPHNVLLSWDGAVKVSDFGIAKARQASEATASVFIKGKPAYMSPEQANGQPLDGRSDLFAVGVMLWEMLVGRRLFVGEDTRATLASVLFGQIPRPRGLRADVPKDLERVVMKLLERDMPARYPNAEAAVHDLLQCADAPKGGRELLMKTLAERFPGQAPVRHSAVRGPIQTPVPGGTPPQGYGHSQPTITPMPSQSLGQFRSAPTNSMGPAATIGQPRKSKVPWIVGGAIASLGVVFGIVAATSGGGDPKPVAQRPIDAAVVTPDAAVPVDAAVVTVAPPVPVDAAPTDAGQKDATSTKTTHAESEKRTGRLVVRAFPVLTVFVDNRKVRDTPVDMKLPVGKHKLRLVNPETGKDEQLTITIEENKSTNIDRM